MKFGRKQTGEATVLYLKRDESMTHARFGFIVSKAVGGAVTRNLVKRRLRSIAREILKNHPTGFDAVIRALPEASTLDWNRLQQEVTSSAEAVFVR
jgi:ribonuclease P protein component